MLEDARIRVTIVSNGMFDVNGVCTSGLCYHFGLFYYVEDIKFRHGNFELNNHLK